MLGSWCIWVAIDLQTVEISDLSLLVGKAGRTKPACVTDARRARSWLYEGPQDTVYRIGLKKKGTSVENRGSIRPPEQFPDSTWLLFCNPTGVKFPSQTLNQVSYDVGNSEHTWEAQGLRESCLMSCEIRTPPFSAWFPGRSQPGELPGQELGNALPGETDWPMKKYSMLN